MTDNSMNATLLSGSASAPKMSAPGTRCIPLRNTGSKLLHDSNEIYVVRRLAETSSFWGFPRYDIYDAKHYENLGSHECFVKDYPGTKASISVRNHEDIGKMLLVEGERPYVFHVSDNLTGESLTTMIRPLKLFEVDCLRSDVQIVDKDRKPFATLVHNFHCCSADIDLVRAKDSKLKLPYGNLKLEADMCQSANVVGYPLAKEMKFRVVDGKGRLVAKGVRYTHLFTLMGRRVESSFKLEFGRGEVSEDEKLRRMAVLNLAMAFEQQYFNHVQIAPLTNMAYDRFMASEHKKLVESGAV